MNEDMQIAHLSQIQTQWSMILQAHQGPSEEADAALDALIRRYGGAVHRYLLRVTKNPETAADLSQEFALRFVRGDFRRADPRLGRFRSFVKTTVLHLVIDHHRRNRNRPLSLIDDAPEPASSAPDLLELDRRFTECWREELLDRAWAELERSERETGRPFHTVLRLRADRPELRSPEMALMLSATLNKAIDAGWVRQNLHRARERFVELILNEVAASLGSDDANCVDEELIDLGLWDYCRSNRKK